MILSRQVLPPSHRPAPAALYGVIIFLGAYLLFSVQPLIAKAILPWFGGSAAVWTASMLFFQIALLGGYAYAHLLARATRPRIAVWSHRTMLFASLLTLPILPSPYWKPASSAFPLWHILALLTATVGFPYLLLASTSPLLQTWYARIYQTRFPYRFFALSNLGSMLALLIYPFLLEPHLHLRDQAWLWSGGYVLYVIGCAWVSRDGVRSGSNEAPEQTDLAVPRAALRVEWLLLSACASGLLLAITNHMTQNIAPIPLLWVLPLALYLLSFIITFDAARWYRREVFLTLFAVAIATMTYGLIRQSTIRDVRVLIPLFSAGLFFCCMVCHGEIVRKKPPAPFLSSFYLTIAIGGALGGMFVAAFAPVVFSGLYELPILLVVAPAVVLWSLRDAVSRRKRILWRLGIAGTAAGAVFLTWTELRQRSEAVWQGRSFYGVLRVSVDSAAGVRELAHGTISHGEQYLDPIRRRIPITYYSAPSGIGLLMTDLEKRGPVKLGVVGLGAGTMAAWGRRGDEICFYEIDPLVLEVARRRFTYLRDTEAKVDVVLGDARLSLDAEAPRNFDVLAIDAFSGDSIPIHLLTREAFRIYRKHLGKRGVLAIHTSNHYLDLSPPIELLAHEIGYEAHLMETLREERTRTFASDWVLVGVDETERFPWMDTEDSSIDTKPGLTPWTDDFSNLYRILK